MTAVGPVTIDMYLPGFPSIEREFGTRGVETTMAAYLVGIAISQLFYGPLSDRFGRKPPLYVGFALYSLGSLGCALAWSLPALTAMRIVQALGGSAGFVIGRAIVRDRCEPHEVARAFSTLAMIVSLGPVVAPALGGAVVTVFGWRATFVFQASLGLALMFAMHHVLRESRVAADGVPLTMAGAARGYLRLLKDRLFVGYTLVGGFGMGALFAYVTGAPTVLTGTYNLPAQHFGLLIALNGLAFMTASRLNIHSLHRAGPRELLARHIWLPTAVGLAFLLLATFANLPLWLAIALQLSFFVSVARVNPNSAALALTPHGRDAGTASALMGALQSVVSMASGLAVAYFNDGTLATLAAIMTVGVVCALLSYLVTRGG